MMCTTGTARLVDEHFAGSIDPEGERAMREHLPGCDACRNYYERHLLFATLEPETALDPQQRLAIGLGLVSSQTRAPGRLTTRHTIPSRALASVAAAVALAAMVVLVAYGHRGGMSHVTEDGAGLTARGRTATPGAAASSRIFVYRVPRGATAGTPAVGTVGRDDELAFAYENATPGARLLLYGIDEHGHVYWFFPAWTNESENPSAVSIEADGRHHELPEAVSHHYDGAHLDLHAVFVNEPMTVGDIEAMLRQKERGAGAPPHAIVEQTLSLEVTP